MLRARFDRDNFGGVGAIAGRSEDATAGNAVDDVSLTPYSDLIDREIHICPRMDWIAGVEPGWSVASGHGRCCGLGGWVGLCLRGRFRRLGSFGWAWIDRDGRSVLGVRGEVRGDWRRNENQRERE